MSELISTINTRLIERYGKTEGEATWRVVFSEDQYEHRLTNYTDEGFELINPEVRELPKYRQWIHRKWILERLMPVAEIDRKILDKNLSYEPIWVFEDNKGQPLEPKWEAIEFIIHQVHTAAAKSVGVKYKDPYSDPELAAQEREKRIEKISEELFGNETDVSDALAHKQAIIVPGNKTIN